MDRKNIYIFCAVFAMALPLYMLFAPVSGNEARVVEISRGEVLSHVADKLKSADAIKSGTLFKLWMYLTWSQNAIRAGEYEIPARATTNQIKNAIAGGRTLNRYITIPEGLTIRQIYEIVDAAPALAGAITLKAEEGELLPQTYAYNKDMTKDDVIAKMKDAMSAALSEEWERRGPGLPFKSPREAVILASIVEKETGVPEERGLVASVFINRMNAAMRLQSCATVVYTLTNRYGNMMGRKLYRKDLAVDTPYNTYTRRGLPAGAISNPGIEALRAVLNPPKTEYFYFVVSGSGGHKFAKTFAEHERNNAEAKKAR